MNVAEFVARAGPSLRGDYAAAYPDFSVRPPETYAPDEHALWRRLHARQLALLPGYADPTFLAHLADLDAAQGVPSLEKASLRLRRATGWELVPVPGLIPDPAFFEHLAHRRFPVTVWLRRPDEFDYIVEPDLFHDFFGHVPLLFDPAYADYLQAYGEGGRKAERIDALPMLARLYWYTVEFGLLRTPQGLRAFGAGILSSGGEVRHAIDSPAPRRIAFDLARVLRTDYRIDRFQDTYFVIDSFRQLVEATAPDFAPLYERVRREPVLAPDAALPSDLPC